MKYKVLFTAYKVRNSPIYSAYRPNWICDHKSEQNCASLIFDEPEFIVPGENGECLLHPFAPDLWNNIQIGDVLQCMEGSRAVGEATILEILN